jgi:hypothetical protein
MTVSLKTNTLLLVYGCISLLPTIARGLSLVDRRQALAAAGMSCCCTLTTPAAFAASAQNENTFNVDEYLKSGMVMNPMGVSGQAGKRKPETGVLLRDGSDVQQDAAGTVLAELLVGKNHVPVLVTFTSAAWPLATGTVFDVECRDVATGDGAFVQVTQATGGKRLEELDDTFFVTGLFAPAGRFSFYGEPTDIKIISKEASMHNNYRTIDVSFSTLSQSTNTEIPRRATIVATIPEGTDRAVMLVGSASALRWKKGANAQVTKTVETFRAIPAPESKLKSRVKERRGQQLDVLSIEEIADS